MAAKMTAEYASAMVTVIPVILLLAAVEFNNARGEYRNQKIRYTQSLLDAVRHGEVEPQPPSKRTLRAHELLWTFWYLVVSSHVYAEVTLIDWLAGTDRGPDPLTAQAVQMVSKFGFVSVILGFVLNKWSVERQRRSEVQRLEELVRRERAERAGRAPVVQVPPDISPGGAP